MSLLEVISEIDEIVCLDDLCYRVRDHAAETATTEEMKLVHNSWDLPVVKRYGKLCNRLQQLLKESGLR